MESSYVAYKSLLMLFTLQHYVFILFIRWSGVGELFVCF